MPEVSVVVPTHNRANMLSLTLRSILRQRDVDFEILVVDDGSSDNTAEVVAKFGDARLRILRNEVPQRVSAARNRGAAAARGEWVAFVDDDDLWAPNKLCLQLAAARSTGRSWVYTGAVSVDDSLTILSGAPPPTPEVVVEVISRYNAVPGGGSNVMARRDALETAGPFDTRLRNTEDWEMWIRLTKLGAPAWVPQPLMAYRVHDANASLDVAQVLAGAALIERTHGTRADYGLLHRWFAESYLRMGHRSDALRHLGLAALKGQARNVTGDLVAIGRRRVLRAFPSFGAQSGRRADRRSDWDSRARPWLDELAATAAGPSSP
jgi:hypothetical protein